MTMPTGTESADVIVVGSGIAGMSAAVAALERGARVLQLERSPEAERGGNTRYTESYWRLSSMDAVSADFTDKLAQNAGGHPDPALVAETAAPYAEWSALARAAPFVDADVIAMLADEAPRVARWLEQMGARFDFLPNYFIAQSTTRMAPVGGGLALLEALFAKAETYGERLTTRFNTTATGLRFESGRVCGVDTVDSEHRARAFQAPNVVLACGGFEGNPEMLAHYVGREATYTRPVARGGQWNRGEGVRMALAAGAAPCGDFGSFHAQPVDPRSPEAEAVMLAYHLGVLVNRRGDRFTDEGAAMIDAVYEETTREIMRQPEGLAYAIVDARVDDVDNWQIAVRSRVPPLEADTIDDLASQMGVSPVRLCRTIASYNGACPDAATQSAQFDVMTTDGLATSDLEPPKSNWARTLDRPPFKAWPIMATNCFTFGGVKIDANARVINMDGVAIPGLYAAGEVAGLYYRVYTGSTSVLRGAVTGRRAGEHSVTRNGPAPG
ncbi:MAG: FAD-dependent oxidoreductase [Pseudomonadota bacterium]